MHLPESLLGLLDLGIVDDVIRPLMSGKEAQVYLVQAGTERRVAKVYKDAQNRSFRQRAQYAEGRRVKNSRRARAMEKRTKYGRAEEELAWKSAEVDAIRLLAAHGVRVPQPFEFVDGVFVMELVAGPDGEPAPRLVDVDLDKEEAQALFSQLVQEVCRMLCAGLVHGDLSDFNILLGTDGPVIIDFPQAVDAAANNNARKLLIRDLQNLQSYFARWVPALKKKRYGEEMWDLYDRGELTPESKLTGRFKHRGGPADTLSVLQEIHEAEAEERAKRERLGLPPLPARSKYAEKKRIQRETLAAAAPPPAPAPEAPSKRKRKRKRSGRGEDRDQAPQTQPRPRDDRSAPPPLLDLDALLLIGDD